MIRAGLALLVTAIALAVATAATAADECRGLQVCLPAAGPWVVVPAGGAPVEYLLACPLRGYVVAGVDARLADAEVDVAFRGETGSPVGPGVTTGQALLFSARSTAAVPRPSSFRPFVGCIPTGGGGGRAQTAYSAAPAGGIRPSRPLERVVVTRPLREGTTVVRLRCPRGGRLLGSAHAVSFRTRKPPSRPLLEAVSVSRAVSGGVVVARAVAAAGSLEGTAPELQLHALCRKAAP